MCIILGKNVWVFSATHRYRARILNQGKLVTLLIYVGGCICLHNGSGKTRDAASTSRAHGPRLSPVLHGIVFSYRVYGKGF